MYFQHLGWALEALADLISAPPPPHTHALANRNKSLKKINKVNIFFSVFQSRELQILDTDSRWRLEMRNPPTGRKM